MSSFLWKRATDLAVTKTLSMPNGQVIDTNRSVKVTGTAATLNVRDHSGKPIILDRAAGIAVVLPAATGSGAEFSFIVATTVTSNSTTIKVANANDVMAGYALQSQDAGATLQMFETAETDDTITFNGTSTGGLRGDRVELCDIAPNVWAVRVTGAATGTEATPFSATV